MVGTLPRPETRLGPVLKNQGVDRRENTPVDMLALLGEQTGWNIGLNFELSHHSRPRIYQQRSLHGNGHEAWIHFV